MPEIEMRILSTLLTAIASRARQNILVEVRRVHRDVLLCATLRKNLGQKCTRDGEPPRVRSDINDNNRSRHLPGVGHVYDPREEREANHGRVCEEAAQVREADFGKATGNNSSFHVGVRRGVFSLGIDLF
jgi:hypothetical protein